MSRLLGQFNPEQMELIAGKVLGELSDSETEQLESFWNDTADAECDSLHLTAASVQTLFNDGEADELPEHLKRQILLDAPLHISNSMEKAANSGLETDHAAQLTDQHGGASPSSVQPLSQAGVGRREWVAWFAAAAALLLAVGSWFGNQQAGFADAADARDQLIDGAKDVIRVAWSPGTTPFASAVTGDVVWSNEKQEGYMRFVGMPANDPTQKQYQLWIIDPQRDDEPIDGGVFDVAADGEIVVPIQAKLRVLQPAAFAITIEKPGGVVVSTQDQLPLLAPVPTTEA